MIELVKRWIPAPLRPALRWAYYAPLDAWERLTGKRDALTPPRSLWFVGGGDFKKAGRRFLTFFVELGGLRPDERVLDVGCGIGRMAVPLTEYLSERGRYEGFDIVEPGIRWCRKTITPRFPHFRFHVADLYNKTYNPKGKYSATDYPFPYPGASFDFAFATSLFTHLLPQETEHYVQEISRVLAPGGRCFVTFFLLNPESEGFIAQGLSERRFGHALPGCRVENPDVPEDAVAYPEEDVISLFARQGFRLRGPVRYGKWPGRSDWLSYQDVLIFEKAADGP